MAISILIVDNDELTGELLLHLITYRLPNAIIHVTAKFDLALELCSKFNVDIVVTSTSMPPTSSDYMLDSIRKIPGNPIKIVIMISSGKNAELEKLAGIDNTYLITKPINTDELISLVKDRIADVEMKRTK
jgi:DNA-binding response OmpR family regulator